MTFTKVIGGFCGALLVYLLGVWAAEILYHVGGGHGHGDDHAKSGYEIEVAVAEEATEEEEVVDFATIYASADVAKGEKVFGKCKACHKLGDGENGTGPHMYQVVGRAVDGVAEVTVVAHADTRIQPLAVVVEDRDALLARGAMPRSRVSHLPTRVAALLPAEVHRGRPSGTLA